MTLKPFVFSLLFLINFGSSSKEIITSLVEDDRIPVLNMATFHFGYTSDATSVEFDEHSDKNRNAAHEIAAAIAKFKPTIIAVENQPQYNEGMQARYQEYLDNPNMKFETPNEINLLAYEVGRLAGVLPEKFVGIDHKLNYQYRFDFNIENVIDSTKYKEFYSNPGKYFPDVKNESQLKNLHEHLIMYNTDQFLDLMITGNADILTHFGSQEDRFQGADQAALYYKRNLRIFANLNSIPVDKNDRIFILSGASHTAFLRDFISRSTKFRNVPILPLLEDTNS